MNRPELSLVPVVETHQSSGFFKTLYRDLEGVEERRTFAPDGDSPAAIKLRKDANRLRDFIPVKKGTVEEARNQRFLDGCEKYKLGAFFGVALRGQSSIEDRKGDAKHCQTLPCLFVDADYKHLGEDETIRRINACKLPPSMVVESGAGLHVYWMLKQPFYLKNEMKDAKRWLSHIAASVADVVDETVSEPARVLRIPGSWNHKYDPPRLVTLSKHTDLVYSLDDFREAFGEPEQATGRQTYTVPETIPKGDRHSLLYRFLRSQKARSVPLEVALAGCHALNTQQCEPPIAEKNSTTTCAVCGSKRTTQTLRVNGKGKPFRIPKPATLNFLRSNTRTMCGLTTPENVGCTSTETVGGRTNKSPF